MCEIVINTSTQQGHSEVQISGTATGFAGLPNYLTDISARVYSLTRRPSAYYPVSISQLSLELVDQSNGLITAQINNAEFKLLGDASAFQKLADFLSSLLELRPGEHFHFDWFGNEYLLAPETATLSVIFSMEIWT
jgi:hypothetical protein